MQNTENKVGEGKVGEGSTSMVMSTEGKWSLRGEPTQVATNWVPLTEKGLWINLVSPSRPPE